MTHRLWAFMAALGALLLVCAVSLARVCFPEGCGSRQETVSPGVVRLSAPRVAAAADNSYCLVCHVNYKEEELACIHQQADVGCMHCHGSSNAHSADENNITPPDMMYAREAADGLCATCHAPCAHEPLLVEAAARDYCSDCHAKGHRLNVRTRRWDKVTGKLIADDGVRMGEKAPGK